MTKKVVPYPYENYRTFLADWVAWKKGSGHFSFRNFAKKAGLSSPNFLQLVISGSRNLAEKGISGFALALDLSEEELHYFENLVRMNQAKSSRERMKFYRRLVRHPARRKFSPLEQAQLRFFQNWLTPIIYEMAAFPDFKLDPSWIAKQFAESPRPQDISQALQDLKLLSQSRSKDGTLTGQINITSGDNIRDTHLFAYHETAISKSGDALFDVPMDERSFNVITVAAPASLMRSMRARFEAFEAEILALVDESTDERDEVFQFSWNLFPLLRRK